MSRNHYYNPSSLWDDTETLISRRDEDEEDEFEEQPRSKRSIYASRDEDGEDEDEEEDDDPEPSEDDLKETEAEVSKLGPLNHVAGEDEPISAPVIPVPTIQKVDFSSNGNGSKPRVKAYVPPVFRQLKANGSCNKEAVMAELKAATEALAVAVERHRIAKLKAIRHLIR